MKDVSPSTACRDIDPFASRMDVTNLWNDDNLSILHTSWSRFRHPDRCEDQARTASLEFMRFGGFRKRVGRSTVIADPNTVVFFRPREVFLIDHPFGAENLGTTFRLEAGLFHDILADARAGSGVLIEGTLLSAVTPPAIHILQHKLVARLRSPEWREPLPVLDMALQILRAMLVRDPGSKSTVLQTRQRKGVIDRVAAVIEFLNRRYTDSLHLTDIADVAGCSPWYIARIFADSVGLPIHQYLNRIRLRQALAVLGDARGNLMGLALSVGFNSHSHFTAAFRREFGHTPTEAFALLASSGVSRRARV